MNSPGRVRHIRLGINALAHCVNDEHDNKTKGKFTNIQRLKKKKKKKVQFQSQTIDASKTLDDFASFGAVVI